MSYRFYFDRQGWIKNKQVIIKIVCFFLVIKHDLGEDFRDCLNFCILLFFNEEKMVKNGVYRDGVLGYSLRLQKVPQSTLFPTTQLTSTSHNGKNKKSSDFIYNNQITIENTAICFSLLNRVRFILVESFFGIANNYRM